MTINKAYDFFKSFATKQLKKSEIKVYEKFLHILTELKNREFSKDEIQSIETELDKFNLASIPENRRNTLREVLSKFENIWDTFSLTNKRYYTEWV
jgi:hypothetical protein